MGGTGCFLIHHVNSLTERKFPVPPRFLIPRKPSSSEWLEIETVFSRLD